MRVVRNELDAAAICLPDGVPPPSELVGEDLGSQAVIFVVARDMKLPASVSLEELSRLSWVINQDGCGFRNALKRHFDAAHLPFNVAAKRTNFAFSTLGADSQRATSHQACKSATLPALVVNSIVSGRPRHRDGQASVPRQTEYRDCWSACSCSPPH